MNFSGNTSCIFPFKIRRFTYEGCVEYNQIDWYSKRIYGLDNEGNGNELDNERVRGRFI